MFIEKIKQKFFDTGAKVLFFFDEEKEYEEIVKGMEDPDIKVLIIEGNYFHIKYTVEHELNGKKIFLYHKFNRPEKSGLKNYPLTDLLFANQEFLIDPTSDIMDQYNIHSKHGALLREYKRWVHAKKYQTELLPILTARPFNPDRFLSAIISLIIGEKRTANDTFNLITILNHLNAGASSWKKHLELIEKYPDLVEYLIQSIRNVTNIQPENLGYDALKSLFLKLKYNIITLPLKEPVPGDRYAHLKISDDISLVKIDRFFKEWDADKEKSKTREILLAELGSDVNEEAIMGTYGVHAEYGIRTKRLLSVIIQQGFHDVVLQPDMIIDRFGLWKNNPDEYGGFEMELGFLLHAAKFFSLVKKYNDFDFNYIEDYIERYRKELYRLDLYYRHAFTWFQKLKRETSLDIVTNVFDELNNRYDQYVIDLNVSWMQILDEKNFNLNEAKTPKQYSFFNDHLKHAENKKVVIISDAFRYELAADLQEALSPDPANKMSVSAAVTSIPSYTNLGMTNLLPHDSIEPVVGQDNINFKVVGLLSGSQNRERILQSFQPESTAIGFAAFTQLSLAEQRDLLKKNRIVYIYHNWMDAIGDKKSSEYYTFESAEQCVEQLNGLIQRLYKSLNTYNILVTADHGFLFNYKEIPETSRQPFPAFQSILKEHTRFCLTHDKMKPEDTYMFPLKNTTNFESEVNVVIPKAINRFRKKGAFGVQFVHGGSSLQEIVIPVFELYRNRRSQARDVTFRRLDDLKSMSTSSAFFKILQDTPIGEEFKPLSIRIGIYDLENNLITSETELTLNATSGLPSDRIYEFKLELNAAGTRSRTGYLRAYANSDIEKLNPLHINDLIKINTLTEIDEF